MAQYIMVTKKLLDRLRAAFKRYGAEVLGDPDITVDFFPTEFDGFFGVFLNSSNFQKMGYTERQNSIWDYLSADPEITEEDLRYITQIATEAEEVELV
ncbi:hypothetical protein L0337_05625 [candidate division KSB1 bacterium]|nr:hypothetical protein [candidate division KSB1 bacterium]